MSHEQARKRVVVLLAVAYGMSLALALLADVRGLQAITAMFVAMSVVFGTAGMAVYMGWEP